MYRTSFILFVVLLFASVVTQAQESDTLEKRCFIGSTLFMLMNLTDDPEPPKYYQLNLGYRVTPKDVVSIEFITWNYYKPLGIPYSKKKKAPKFPGRVQAYGAGLSYKRFIWKRAYAQVHSTLFHQNYLDESGGKIQDGMQLFNTLRVGYQFRLLKNRLFIEPSFAVTSWPVNTNLPESFQVEEDKWNNFTYEPGLHFGYNF